MSALSKLASLLGLFDGTLPLANRNHIVDPQFEQTAGAAGSSTGVAPVWSKCVMYYVMGGTGGTLASAQFGTSDVPATQPAGMFQPMWQGLKLTQSTPHTGSAATTTASGVWQNVEDVRTLSGGSATFSCWLWLAGGGPVTIPAAIVRQGFGTGGSPAAQVVIDPTVNWVVTTTPKRFSVRVDLPPTAGKATGSSGNSNLQVGLWFPPSVAFTLLTTQWQLESCPATAPATGLPTAFEYRGPQAELARAQRFYQTLRMGIDIPVGVGAAAVGAFSNYAVTMRAVPAASVTTLVESANFTGAVLDMATPSSIRYRGASVSGPNNLYVTVDIALDARL